MFRIQPTIIPSCYPSSDVIFSRMDETTSLPFCSPTVLPLSYQECDHTVSIDKDMSLSDDMCAMNFDGNNNSDIICDEDNYDFNNCFENDHYDISNQSCNSQWEEYKDGFNEQPPNILQHENNQYGHNDNAISFDDFVEDWGNDDISFMEAIDDFLGNNSSYIDSNNPINRDNVTYNNARISDSSYSFNKRPLGIPNYPICHNTYSSSSSSYQQSISSEYSKNKNVNKSIARCVSTAKRARTNGRFKKRQIHWLSISEMQGGNNNDDNDNE